MKPTVVIRHRRENLKKCSLRGLETRKDFIFYTYPKDVVPKLEGYVLLSFDGQPLTEEDKGIIIIDGTWRLAGDILRNTEALKGLETRSLPSGFKTAYPRRQDDCEDPSRGLASLEAIYVAHLILGRDVGGLLEKYYWKDQFLENNSLPFFLNAPAAPS